jgi:hypothetical protein
MTNQRPQRSILMRVLYAPFAAFGFIIGFPLTLLFATVLRGRCPHCQRKGLRGALCGPDPALTGDTQPFFFSECDYCHHQFWQSRGQTAVHHIAPTDAHYIRVT